MATGDILQFRDHLNVVTTVTTVTFADGSGYVDAHTEDYRRPHHSAVVVSYEPGVVKVFLNSAELGTQSSMKTLKTTAVSSNQRRSRRVAGGPLRP